MLLFQPHYESSRKQIFEAQSLSQSARGRTHRHWLLLGAAAGEDWFSWQKNVVVAVFNILLSELLALPSLLEEALSFASLFQVKQRRRYLGLHWRTLTAWHAKLSLTSIPTQSNGRHAFFVKILSRIVVKPYLFLSASSKLFVILLLSTLLWSEVLFVYLYCYVPGCLVSITLLGPFFFGSAAWCSVLWRLATGCCSSSITFLTLTG